MDYRKQSSMNVKLSLGNRGSVLVISLLLTTLLTSIGIGFLSGSWKEVSIAFNETYLTQAFYLAEAGVAEGTRILRDSPNVDNQLVAPQPFNCPGLVPASDGGCSFTIVNNAADPGGANDDTDGILVVTSTGAFRNASSTVEARLGPTAPAAITVDGDLSIPGNPPIGGTQGSVHTNSDLTISGNPGISQDATASGTYSESGNPTIGGNAQGGVPPIPLPIIDPTAYFGRAEYILQADGKVVRASDGAVMLDTAATGNSWPANNGGWKRSSGPPQVKWEWGGNTITNPGAESIFYVEGDAQVSANPGTTGNPWDATIIATGHIDISGNPTVQAKDGDGLLFVAGTDVKISGNPGISYVGIILANEQLSISGQPTFTGFAIASDKTSTDPFIVDNEISGNPTITYNGAPPPPPNLFPIRLISWRELAL